MKAIELIGLTPEYWAKLDQQPSKEGFARRAVRQAVMKGYIVTPGQYERTATTPHRYKYRNRGLVIRWYGRSAHLEIKRIRKYATDLGFTSVPQWLHHVVCDALDHQ